MPFTLSDAIGMILRNSPVSKIRQALIMCETAGLDLTTKDLESHHFCGGDPLTLAGALFAVKDLGVSTTFHELAVLALGGHDPLTLLASASKHRVESFDTFSPTRTDKIRGFTMNHKEVSAVITIIFRLSPSQLAFDFDIRYVHERLSAAVSVFINTAIDLRTLQIRQPEHEAELKLLGLDALPGLQGVTIEYR